MSASCEYCVLSASGLCDDRSFIQRSLIECGMPECDLDTSTRRPRLQQERLRHKKTPWPNLPHPSPPANPQCSYPRYVYVLSTDKNWATSRYIHHRRICGTDGQSLRTQKRVTLTSNAWMITTGAIYIRHKLPIHLNYQMGTSNSLMTTKSPSLKITIKAQKTFECCVSATDFRKAVLRRNKGLIINASH
jgi:hypothetical protein